MSDNTTPTRPTRRDTIKYGSAVVSGGLLAGCTGEADPEQEAEPQQEADTEPTDDSYTVSMPPMGDVEFDAVPQSYMSYRVTHADMGIALGVGDRLKAVYKIDQYPFEFYDELPDVEIGVESLSEMELNEDYSVDKEWFYEQNVDVHLMDPEYMSQWLLTPEDVEEISRNVGPFFGHYARRRIGEERDYPFLSLYEIFEKV